MANYYSTKQVAEMLGVSVANLQQAIFRGKLEPPDHGPGRAFLWTPRDIDRASWVLRRRGWDLYRPGPHRTDTLTSIGAVA